MAAANASEDMTNKRNVPHRPACSNAGHTSIRAGGNKHRCPTSSAIPVASISSIAPGPNISGGGGRPGDATTSASALDSNGDAGGEDEGDDGREGHGGNEAKDEATAGVASSFEDALSPDGTVRRVARNLAAKGATAAYKSKPPNSDSAPTGSDVTGVPRDKAGEGWSGWNGCVSVGW